MSDPDGLTTGQQIGGGLAALLSGLGLGRILKRNGHSRPSDTDRIVAAIDKLHAALMADLKETRHAMHERFNQIDEQLHDAEVARATFVAAENERRRRE